MKYKATGFEAGGRRQGGRKDDERFLLVIKAVVVKMTTDTAPALADTANVVPFYKIPDS
ncbi:MAG: hypothetical protein V7L13_11330 [Nostoc sp.]|uniref:hypothetical protein n=1 Tax=Nostoc sp. TaxID=1180 RepID=UPI002FF587A4